MIPIEWLNDIVHDRDGYRRLLDEEGSLARAAYTLALAKCRSRERATEVPTRAEVRAAARVIARHTEIPLVPASAVLAADLEAEGVNVL